jgi:hypothetical protein
LEAATGSNWSNEHGTLHLDAELSRALFGSFVSVGVDLFVIQRYTKGSPISTRPCCLLDLSLVQRLPLDYLAFVVALCLPSAHVFLCCCRVLFGNKTVAVVLAISLVGLWISPRPVCKEPAYEQLQGLDAVVVAICLRCASRGCRHCKISDIIGTLALPCLIWIMCAPAKCRNMVRKAACCRVGL